MYSLMNSLKRWSNSKQHVGTAVDSSRPLVGLKSTKEAVRARLAQRKPNAKHHRETTLFYLFLFLFILYSDINSDFTFIYLPYFHTTCCIIYYESYIINCNLNILSLHLNCFYY